MLNMIYESFVADPIIQEKVENRIKFYEYPETANLTDAHIIIDPLDVPIPSDFADNTWMKEDYLFQIEVWSNNLADTQTIAKRIREIMWELNFSQGSGVDEWEKDLNIFRDARRYRGKVYTDRIS